MKTGNVLLIGGLAAAVWYFGGLGIAGSTVQFVFQNVIPLSLTNFQIQILVQNISNAEVDLNAMSGQVFLNGNAIGNVSYFPSVPTTILPTSQQLVTFSLDISILNLGPAIAQIITAFTSQTQGSGTMNFEIKGNANINKLVIPFDLTNTISL